MEQEVVGLILPLTREMAKSMERKKSFVFPKFMGQEKIPKEMRKGKIILFYCSGNIIGEGKIKKIELIKARDLLKKHQKDLLATKEDFENYIKDRKDKKMVVFYIGLSKIYEHEKSVFFPVPMSGRYIKEREYKSLKNRA